MPSPKPYHPEDVEVDMSSLRFTEKFSYQEVKNLLLPYFIDPEEFYRMFEGNRKVPGSIYKGKSIFILPFYDYSMEIECKSIYDLRRQAFINIGGIRLPITYWFERSFWNNLKVGDKLRLNKKDGFLIITLSLPFNDGYCYLLCSGILSPYKDKDLFEF